MACDFDLIQQQTLAFMQRVYVFPGPPPRASHHPLIRPCTRFASSYVRRATVSVIDLSELLKALVWALARSSRALAVVVVAVVLRKEVRGIGFCGLSQTCDRMLREHVQSRG